MQNNTAFLSYTDHCEQNTQVASLLLWPWPWPDDLDKQTRPDRSAAWNFGLVAMWFN